MSRIQQNYYPVYVVSNRRDQASRDSSEMTHSGAECMQACKHSCIHLQIL